MCSLLNVASLALPKRATSIIVKFIAGDITRTNNVGTNVVARPYIVGEI
jgi:hypothetical protein